MGQVKALAVGSVNSGKILYFCIHDVERLGFGGYGSLGEPPSAGQPAAV